MDGLDELSVVELEGDAEELLASETLQFGRPTFGPDSRITVAANDSIGNGQVLSFGPRHIRQLEIVVGEPCSYAEPDWSADGRWLAVEGQPTQRLRGMTVFLRHESWASARVVAPQEEPEPKAACPRFAPSRPTLAYARTDSGVTESSIHLLDAPSGTTAAVAATGLDDPRWSHDGVAILAASHSSVCASGLVVIDPSSLRSRPIWSESSMRASPCGMNERDAFAIVRRCGSSEEQPTAPGELWQFSTTGGAAARLAEGAYLAEVLD